MRKFYLNIPIIFFILFFGIKARVIAQDNSDLSIQPNSQRNVSASVTKIDDNKAKSLAQTLSLDLLRALSSNTDPQILESLFLDRKDLEWMMTQYKSSRLELDAKAIELARKDMSERSTEARRSFQSLIGQTQNIEMTNAGGTYELNINWVGCELKITTPQKTFVTRLATIYNGSSLKIVLAPSF